MAVRPRIVPPASPPASIGRRDFHSGWVTRSPAESRIVPPAVPLRHSACFLAALSRKKLGHQQLLGFSPISRRRTLIPPPEFIRTTAKETELLITRSESGLISTTERRAIGRSITTSTIRPSTAPCPRTEQASRAFPRRSEEHTSELQSRFDLVCRL